MNSENSNTSDPLSLLLNLSDKIDLKRSNVLLYLICQKVCKNNEFKISAST